MINFSNKMLSTASMIIFDESDVYEAVTPMIISMHVGDIPSLIDTYIPFPKPYFIYLFIYRLRILRILSVK